MFNRRDLEEPLLEEQPGPQQAAVHRRQIRAIVISGAGPHEALQHHQEGLSPDGLPGLIDRLQRRQNINRDDREQQSSQQQELVATIIANAGAHDQVEALDAARAESNLDQDLQEEVSPPQLNLIYALNLLIVAYVITMTILILRSFDDK